MNKSFLAAIVAVLMTACVGAAILGIGEAALANKNISPLSNSPIQVVGNADPSTTQPTDQVTQLQNLISQYQDREQQYQQREQQLEGQLAQATSQIQADQETIRQAQLLLQALQQRGIIRISDDGRIFITQ